MGFEWQVELEREERPFAAKKRPKRPRRFWLLLSLVAIVVVASTAAWWTKREADRRLDGVKADVLAAHTLTLQAIAGGDEELLNSQLDYQESDGLWRLAQKTLIDFHYERRPFGLTLTEDGAPVGEATVELAPDLQTATVTFQRTYRPLGSAGAAGQRLTPIQLQYVALYRRHDDGRWLLREPGEAFWGPTQTFEGEWITVTYPQRDAEFVEPWATEVDDLIATLCREMTQARCSTQLALTLALSSDPMAWGSVIDSQSIPAMLSQESFALPTPTLFGQPVEERSRQILLDIYDTLVIKEAVAQFREAGLPLSTLTVLANDGVRPWPLLEATELEAPPVPFPPPVHLLCSGNQAAQGLRQYDPVADVWTERLAPRRFVHGEPVANGGGLLLQERRFLENGTEEAIVRWRDGEADILYEIGPEYVDTRWRFGPQSPDGRYLLLDLFNWQDFRPTPQLLELAQCNASDCPARELHGFPVWSPDGEHMLLLPITSSGEYTDSFVLSSGDGTVSLQSLHVEFGYRPFWLNSETFGYQKVDEIVIVQVADPTEPVVLSNRTLREQLPPAEKDFTQWFRGTAIPSPANNAFYFIFRTEKRNFDEDKAPTISQYLFHVTFEETAGASALQMKAEFLMTLAETGHVYVSPDGRWLAIGQLEEAVWEVQLYRLDEEGRIDGPPQLTRTYPLPLTYQLATNFSTPSPTPNPFWSSDGNWLLVEYDGVLQFLALQHEYEKVYVPPEIGCAVLGWAG